MVKISVVTPVYNEEGNVDLMAEKKSPPSVSSPTILPSKGMSQ